MKAMKQLLDLHEQRYRYHYVDMAAVASGRAILKQLAQWRDSRNRTAHAVWLRLGDGAMFAFEPEAVQYTTASKDKGKPIRNEDLQDLIDATIPLIESVEAFVSMLPEVPEAPPRSSP